MTCTYSFIFVGRLLLGITLSTHIWKPYIELARKYGGAGMATVLIVSVERRGRAVLSRNMLLDAA